MAAIRIPGWGAGFIEVSHRLPSGHLQGLPCRVLQGCTQSLADGGDPTAADLNRQQLIQQRLGCAETQGEGTAQEPHQGTAPGPVAAGLHIRRQRRQVLVEQQGQTKRCNRGSITIDVIGRISIT